MFQERSQKKELLDATDIPFQDLERNLKEIDKINQWFGGHAVNKKGILQLTRHLPPGADVHICELGCGNGNNIRALNYSSLGKRFRLKFTGIDIKKECIEAALKYEHEENISYVMADYRAVQFREDNRPDIIFSSLFCHHFSIDELVTQWRWMNQEAQLGAVINDLHRHPMSYYFIRWISRVFDGTYLLQHDAPLSVLRGFVRKDLEEIIKAANITRYHIAWEWAFRYLVVLKK